LKQYFFLQYNMSKSIWNRDKENSIYTHRNEDREKTVKYIDIRYKN